MQHLAICSTCSMPLHCQSNSAKWRDKIAHHGKIVRTARGVETVWCKGVGMDA